MNFTKHDKHRSFSVNPGKKRYLQNDRWFFRWSENLSPISGPNDPPGKVLRENCYCEKNTIDHGPPESTPTTPLSSAIFVGFPQPARFIDKAASLIAVMRTIYT